MTATLHIGDVLDRLAVMPSDSVQCVVTSPPYWGLRDYGVAGQIGLEGTPEEFIDKMVEVFREVRRVLRNDGTAWINMGDSYANDGKWGKSTGGKHVAALHGEPIGRGKRITRLKPKDLCGIPWMLAFALRSDGWFLRQDLIWHKPNPMPESVTDRCTKAHEYIFLTTKSARYYYDQEAILEPCSPATHARLAQDVQAQVGSERAHAGGKTNGNMKAVVRVPGAYKGSVPGRKDGPGQDRRGAGDRGRLLGEKGQQADPETTRSAKGAAFGRGAGWRKLAEAGSGTKNNESFDEAMAIMPEKRNKRSVWTIPSQAFSEAHFATYPEALVEPCILAGSRERDTALDPFCGSGTTGVVALRYNRQFIGIELNPTYAALAEKRIREAAPLLNQVEVIA